MIKRSVLTTYKVIQTRDELGGVTEELQVDKIYRVKISISNNVAIASQYNVMTNQLLNVVSSTELPSNTRYYYQDKTYELRGQLSSNREFFAVLTEVV